MSQTAKPNQNQSQNRDQGELDKFGEQAHYWWDPQGPLWTLHAMNPLRAGFIDGKVNVAEKKLLDVGCGAGLLTEAMAYRGAIATGLDLASEVLNTARKHAQDSNLEISYQEQSVESLAVQAPESFDVITCMEMLEHVPNPKSIVDSVASLLKPGGFAFFSTLNREPSAFLQAILGAEYVLGIVPKGTHSYEKFIKPSELCSWTREGDLQTLDLKGIGYNPFLKTFKLTNKTNVNYLLAVRKAHA